MNKRNKLVDRLCASLFGAFGIFVLIAIPANIGARKYDVLGSRFFPYAVAAAMVLTACILFVNTFISEDYQGKKEGLFDNETMRNTARTAVFCVILFASVWLLQNVHFFAGAVTLTTSMLILCKAKKVSWYVIIYAIITAIYFLFTNVFKIRL